MEDMRKYHQYLMRLLSPLMSLMLERGQDMVCRLETEDYIGSIKVRQNLKKSNLRF